MGLVIGVVDEESPCKHPERPFIPLETQNIRTPPNEVK